MSVRMGSVVTGRRGGITVLGSILAAVLLSGCSGDNDALSSQYKDGTTQNYVSGDGAVSEIRPADRGQPVTFDVDALDGTPLQSKDLRGRVLVINFWYASCPPCRAEAKHLNAVATRYADQGVQFIGVNVRDQQATAEAFERQHNVSYPSVLDANTGTMQLALSGQIAPNAVPTTLVLDKQGRIAARILGAIDGPGTLATLVGDEAARSS